MPPVKAGVATTSVWREVRVTAFAVWGIVTLAGVVALAAPFMLPEERVLALGAALQTPHAPGEICALCGMTRASLALARGDIDAALALNRGSLLLYGFFALNAVTFGAVLARWPRRRRSSVARREGRATAG